MHTILIVDDDLMVRSLIREFLHTNGFLTIEAAHGKRCVEILEKHKVDLILLDVGLPDVDGISLISQIKSFTNVPIVILSGNRDGEDKIKGLNAGADDYIGKPFDPYVLLAYLKANIRRYETGGQSLESKNQTGTLVVFGDWTLDLGAYQVFHETGDSADLTLPEFELLKTLIDNAGRALKRDEIANAIKNQTQKPTDRAIDIKVARVRKKIHDDAAEPLFIVTVRGVGYMFNEDKLRYHGMAVQHS